MKVSAVICEYNPFHNGHKYQLKRAREITGCDAVVGLMSGDFVQRGDFALLPKRVRASAALLNGVDLILENPSYLTLKSAEGYAYSAVYTLNAMGCVDYLVFGCETDDMRMLMKIAEFLVCEDDDFKKVLSANLAKGNQFAAARSTAVEKALGSEAAEIMKQPNNLLAIEYIKALLRTESSVEPIAIKRMGVGHNDDTSNGSFASASYIRSKMKEEDISPYCPANVCEMYNVKPFPYDKVNASVISSLAMKSAYELARTPGVTEGLENKIKAELFKANTMDELIAAVKSKRYAYSRIRRVIMCAYLGIDDEESEKLPEYIKILDFNDKGRKVLNTAKKTAKLPLAKSASPIMKNVSAMTQWKRELERERVYEILCSL